MNGDDLRELHALVYPAAAKAIRAYGTWRYDLRETDHLDWTTILVTLHDAGMVMPGPTLGDVSFWYITWRFGSPSISDGLNDILGHSWAEAARYCLWRDAIRGPRVKARLGRWLRSMDGIEQRRDSQLRYAFRLLDEPTPWRSRIPKGQRSGRGQIPLRWTSVPWLVPLDLKDRPCLTDHFQTMSTGDSEANSKWISDTSAAALATSDVPSIARFLRVLNAFKNDPVLPFAEAARCMEAIKEVRDHLEDAVVRRIEASMSDYEETGDADFLATAKGYLSHMPEGIRASDLSTRLNALKPRVDEQTQ